MKLDPHILEQLLQIFKVELEEQLQAITDGLLELEKDSSGTARVKILDNIFRAAHNIKGAARGIDISDVAEIAHSLESLFSTLRKGEIVASAQTISLCLFCLDRMREAMTAFELKQTVSFDLPALTQQLNNWQNDANKESLPSTESLNSATLQILEGKQSEPDQTQTVATTAHAKEAVPQNDSPKIAVTRDASVEVTRVALSKLEHVSSLVEELQVSKIEMEDHLAMLYQLSFEVQSLAQQWVQLTPELEGNLGAKSSVHASLKLSTQGMNGISADAQRLYKQMRISHNRLSQVSGALQDQVRTLRLVPVSTLLRPLARLVRDIAQELGKQVEYDVIGDGIEMDRPVLEGLKDPLIHLLRNAIDHGIESPEERRAKGKPEVSRLIITVTSEGSRIALTIQDDGAGINIDRIAHAAVKKKLLTAAEVEAMSPSETLDLIFRPGFSSKEIITNISGRGVGLDVVASNLRELKGNVSIKTIEHEGTSFILNLPLTLSTDHGLTVRVGETLYAIPTASIVKVMDIKITELIDVEASQAIIIEGKAVPVRILADVLGISSPQKKDVDRLSIVVLAKGWQSVAFIVEEIIGEREIVIKRLKPPLFSVNNVIGGTLTGSGKVIMVLDPPDLVSSALRLGMSSRVNTEDQNIGIKPLHILVVDDSITSRTLEKNILESQGYRVTVAVNGQLGWEALQKDNFDLIVTDVEMPDMNGFELTEQIKSSQKYQVIPVIIVTSLANETDRQRGIEVGADAYIVKGHFETKVLLDVVNQLL